MCESKVQACVKPKPSAFLVSSTTRLAGGFVCSVTPKSMPLSYPRLCHHSRNPEGILVNAECQWAMPLNAAVSRSMPLVLPRDGGDGAKGDQDAARDEPLRLPERRALHPQPQPASCCAGEQGVEAVRAQGEDYERGPEKQDLGPRRTARRVHELGQESEEEQRRLRVEGVDHHALPEHTR